MQAERRRKFVIASLLVVLILIVIVSVQENMIPTATYELKPGDPINEDEAIEITSYPQSTVTSAVLLNDSLLSPDSIWFKDSYRWTGHIHLSRQIPVPRINVSAITLRLSAFIVKGPSNINLRYYDWPHDSNVNGSTGETVEIVRHILPDDLGRSGLTWIGVTINSTDLSVIDNLYFSVSVVFTTNMLPVTMDLQRTNGNSLFNLPELHNIHQTSNRPYIQFDDHEFYFSQVNDTIFLPADTYSLSIRWLDYQHFFGDISVENESLYLELRIKTVRLDVESLQKLPGIAIHVERSMYNDFYYHEIMIADEPSFYLPSMSYVSISVRGDVDSYYWPLHFTFYIDNYENRNITLVVSENWILVGDIAFTPGRFVMLIALISIFILTFVISRKELLTSSIYLPFLLLFLGNTLPMYTLDQTSGMDPFRIPLYSLYDETQSVSSGISTSITSINGTAVAVSDAGYEVATQIGFISLTLLLFVFITVIYEYLRKEQDPETSDFPVVAPIICSMVLQTVFIVSRFFSTLGYFAFSLGPGLAFTSLALVMWIVLFKRQGKTIFETN
jgi:hypothetical protein